MRRLSSPLMALALGALLGCGGSSSSDPFVPGPTGGGGRIADYVGAYSGDEFALPSASDGVGSATHSGTLALTVDADGTVSGTRTPDGGAPTAISGRITDEGTLSLNDGNVGSLAKRADGRLVGALARQESGGDAPVFYRLSGGSADAAPAPLTTGLVRLGGGEIAGSLRLPGRWLRPEAGTSGALSLSVSPEGRLAGSWTRADGKVGRLDGALYDTAETSPAYSLAGRATTRFPDGAAATFDLRLKAIEIPPTLGPAYYTGSAVQTDGDGEYALVLSFG